MHNQTGIILIISKFKCLPSTNNELVKIIKKLILLRSVWYDRKKIEGNFFKEIDG
jgi:hypothetical protein